MDAGVGLGLGYRYEDALVPNVEFRYSNLKWVIIYTGIGDTAILSKHPALHP